MKRFEWLAAILSIVVLFAGAQAARAAGGTPAPSTSPADQAADAYNRGLKCRDKAWKLEEQASAASSAAQREKLETKARKEYEKAARAFSSAIDADPRMHQAHSSLGYALRKTGRFEESLQAYDRALELQPGYTEAIEYRAEAYLGLDRLGDAKQAYLQLFRDDRERADELMSAMRRWVEERRVEPGDLDRTMIEEFAGWVEERSEISHHSRGLTRSTARTW